MLRSELLAATKDNPIVIETAKKRKKKNQYELLVKAYEDAVRAINDKLDLLVQMNKAKETSSSLGDSVRRIPIPSPS